MSGDSIKVEFPISTRDVVSCSFIALVINNIAMVSGYQSKAKGVGTLKEDILHKEYDADFQHYGCGRLEVDCNSFGKELFCRTQQH